MGLEVIINNYWNQSSQGAISEEGELQACGEEGAVIMSSCHHDTLLVTGHVKCVMVGGSQVWDQVFATGIRSSDPTVRGMSSV